MKYCIKIVSDEVEMERIFNILFQKGFVMERERIRTWQKAKEFLNRTINNHYDRWLRFGHDKECRMLMLIGFGDWSREPDWQGVTVEEFVQLIDSGTVI